MKKLKSVICLILCAACLACTAGCARKWPDDDNVVWHGDNIVYQGADKNGEYFTPGEGIQLLSASEFHSDRTAENVGNSFKVGYYDLALKLLRECEADNKDSTMISPLSVMTALAMTANGADGETLAQMQNLLCGLSVPALNSGLYNFYAGLTSTDDALFRGSNSVWVTNRRDFKVNKDFIRIIENTYDAEIFSADFRDPQTVGAVNDWCSDKTDGMIKKVIEEFGDNTIMTLINALCFDALWDEPYIETEGEFNGTSGKQNVTMLSGTEKIYIDGKNEKGFIKRYMGATKNSGYSFVALLPDKEGNIGDYLKKLDGKYLLTLVDGAESCGVFTKMPAFSADYSVEMNEILSKLGMDIAFDPDRADFSGLGKTDDNSNIYISNVIHKTHIDVDASGTRAAAVTAVIMAEKTSARHTAEPPRVILDRPFVYAIIDNATSCPIFIGVCENVA